MARTEPFRVVLVTCGSLAEGRKIARSAVERKLAACVNISSAAVESVYRWKGKIESGREYLLIMKTTARRLNELEREVKRLHSYETPEFVALEVKGGSKAYLEWIAESVR
ncbi:MAG: divalent-cation tolerance protein CutA [Candidatus Acidiferrum sp.]